MARSLVFILIFSCVVCSTKSFSKIIVRKNFLKLLALERDEIKKTLGENTQKKIKNYAEKNCVSRFTQLLNIRGFGKKKALKISEILGDRFLC